MNLIKLIFKKNFKEEKEKITQNHNKEYEDLNKKSKEEKSKNEKKNNLKKRLKY